MKSKPTQPTNFEETVVGQLACPACFSALRRDEAHLVCTACSRAYPIVDGIPVLIIERAELDGAQPDRSE
jgi:uncharacterized protein YbaR (Trm112 family)